MSEAGRRTTGHVLLWAGFLAAAFVSTRQQDAVEWSWYAVAVTIGAAGIVMLRAKAATSGEGKAQAEIEVARLGEILEKIGADLARLKRERDSIAVADVRNSIDERLAPHLRDFDESREALSSVHGLEAYVEVMSRFAAAERNINRAWSASADGYVDEVWACVERAEGLLREATNALGQYRSQPS